MQPCKDLLTYSCKSSDSAIHRKMLRAWRKTFAVLVLSIGFFKAMGRTMSLEAVINNVEPRRTTDGKIINAHDGALYEFEKGVFTLIGTAYSECEGLTNCSSRIGDCGWQDNDFAAYTSTNLMDWTLASPNLIPDRSPDLRQGANFRPKVLKNKDGEYVMWFNHQPGSHQRNIPGYYIVAVAKRPIGPYMITNANASVSRPLNGDFNLFADNDGAGFIVYNSDMNGHLCQACHIPPCDCGFQMSVERLAPDFKSSAMENSGWIGPPTVEAPAMFRRGNVYYLLFDRLSCFGPQGSGAVVYSATDAMGPYTARNNINRYGPFRPNQLSFVIVPAQQTYVARIGDAFVWQGDLWDSYTTPDGRNVKAFDYQAWLPLSFHADGNISKLQWRDEWSVRLSEH